MKRVALVPIGVVAVTLLFPCAPDTTPSFKPAQKQEEIIDFEHGKLGLITPDFSKTDELVAYRYLNGLTLDDTAAKLGRKPSVTATSPADDPPIEAWRKARLAVPPAPTPPSNGYFGPYRMSRVSKDVYYLNCLDDAFSTAVRTLADRSRQYNNNFALRAWTEAQDIVFANCDGIPLGSPPRYPGEPGAGFSALERADRLYQIAAAHFYAEDFDVAEKLFRDIAADQASPWRQTAAYMVGRTLLREYSLANKAEAADQARVVFQTIAADPGAGTLRDSARGLIEHLEAIAHSPETLQSLADRLMTPASGAPFVKTVGEAQYLLVADSFRAAISKPDIPDPFDWVRTLESGDEKHALARWQTTNRLPWLALALIHASGQDAAASDLIEAASRVHGDSPAFVTVTYNAIRLRVERGETDEPRAQLDRLLAGEATQPASVRNAWRALRIQLATNFDDFLRWAPRTPTNARDFSDDPREQSPILADDSVAILNYATPLPKMVQAVRSPRLRAWSASRLAMVAWIRAFMLGNNAAMNILAPRVAKDHPDWAADLTPKSGADADAWRFRASLLVARNAQFTPTLDVDFRKPVDPNDGWWCAVELPETSRQPDSPTVAWRVPVRTSVPDTVVSTAERTQARGELNRLRDSGSAQAFIGPLILAWAKAHPDDPLVPEALYRVVRVTRYGCHGLSDNGKISKAAFDLLHNQYPQNPWTAKTPYWFSY
jgi:hypothetical protein